MKAMVLCAGLGTRLRPITDSIPKPLAPLFGVPAVERTIAALAGAGVDSAVVNLHHLPQKVRDTLGSSCRGVSIEYSFEETILGPVGALGQAVDMLGDEPFFVSNGDIVIDIDPSEVIKAHKESGAAMTMAVGKIPDKPKIHVVGCDESGRVVKIIDCSTGGTPTDHYVNLGFYVYDPDIVRRHVPRGKPFGFVDGIIPLMFAAGDKIMSYKFEGYWNDIGNPADYLRAHFDGLDGKWNISGLGDGAAHAGGEAPNWISAAATIESGAKIGAYTVACPGAVVESGAETGRAVILPGARAMNGGAAKNGIVAQCGFVPEI